MIFHVSKNGDACSLVRRRLLAALIISSPWCCTEGAALKTGRYLELRQEPEDSFICLLLLDFRAHSNICWPEVSIRSETKKVHKKAKPIK